MSYFAASYEQSDNNLWLNELVGDIISPTEEQEDVDWDNEYDRIADGEDGRGRTSRAHRRRESARSLASSLGFMRRSSTRRTSISRSRLSVDRAGRTLQAYAHEPRDHTRASSPWLGSEPTVLGSRQSLQSSFTPDAPPQKPALAVPRSDSRFSLRRKTDEKPYNPQNLAPRLERSQTEQSSLTLKRSATAMSLESAFSGFAPHPGVRPLEVIRARKVLGEAAGPTEEDHEYPGPLALGLIIVGICLSVFIISLDRNIITTAIPEITARFHSYNDIGWYGSAYLLTASAFQPLYGRIYMSFNTKWSFLGALIVFEIGSLICGIAPSSEALIIGRAVQGLGSAGILTGSFVVGTHSVRLQARPVLFAFVGILYGVGALCGPLLGGTFTQLVSWRWCFYINLPIGGFTFVAVFFFFKPQPSATSADRLPFWKRVASLDWIGNIILLGACTMLFLALQFSEERYSWSSAPCIGLIVGFGVTAMIFIAWIFYKGDTALIPIHIVKQRTVAASCGAAFFIYGALLLHSYYLPIWFQAIKNASAIESGVNMIPYMVTNAFFSLFAGIFVSKNGLFAPPAILGCAIGTVGAGLLATLHPDTSTAKWVGFEVLVSAGLGMAIQQGFSAVQTALPLHEVPIGTAAVVACQSAGGAIFVSVGNTLLQNHLLNANNAQVIPGVNIRAIIELGATQFRHVVPPADLPALIELYNDALQAALIAAVPLCGCAFLCSLCMEWKSVKRAPPGAPKEEDVEKKAADIKEYTVESNRQLSVVTEDESPAEPPNIGSAYFAAQDSGRKSESKSRRSSKAWSKRDSWYNGENLQSVKEREFE